jgi:hypothetical protein
VQAVWITSIPKGPVPFDPPVRYAPPVMLSAATPCAVLCWACALHRLCLNVSDAGGAVTTSGVTCDGVPV